jgi:hypothetical protein
MPASARENLFAVLFAGELQRLEVVCPQRDSNSCYRLEDSMDQQKHLSFDRIWEQNHRRLLAVLLAVRCRGLRINIHIVHYWRKRQVSNIPTSWERMRPAPPRGVGSTSARHPKKTTWIGLRGNRSTLTTNIFSHSIHDFAHFSRSSRVLTANTTPSGLKG